MQGLCHFFLVFPTDLAEKEERAAFGKRLKREEAWMAEYRLKQNTAALT